MTYTTVLTVANDDLALRPGMTASAEIIIAHRDAALLVPNAALRFNPAREGANAPGASSSFLSRLMPRMPRQQRGGGNGSGARSSGNGEEGSRVWVLENGQPRPVSFRSGVSNGRYTEVLEGELKAGMPIITDYQEIRP